MIDESFIQNAIRIRKTYLKLSSNMNLYQKKAQEVADRLDDTLQKVDELSKKAEVSKNSNTQTNNLLGELLDILKTVESDGESLENLVNPLNKEIEKLALEEQELYRLIKERHFNVSDDLIIEEVQSRLKSENLL